ncbi:hypothetical protein J6500_13360 [Bradyrhizobium sp. WSM 1704]|uniref:hypothetical protein n=1 Tax=Bradyrhizobium semiaridum TaxID=2821404 RepID=UPI001CE37267|nr:hypothetical protein [Bradyrhizobium semiaridum]MCA6122878.1 hypothetical protein [Bradyrhizobium semiaridum]
MRKLSATTALATIVFLLAPAAGFAQGTGGAGGSAGAGTGSPSPSGTSGTASSQLGSPRGTNSAGTAQSSGRPNSGEGVTTGSASGQSIDKTIEDENRSVDHRLKGICRGC